MAFLALNGVDIPVARDTVTGEVQRFGDEGDAWDGTRLTRRRARKREWTFRTTPLNGASITNFRTLFETAPPHAATGDLTGTTSVTVVRESTMTLKGLSRWTSFEVAMREE
jgi:hypothetical protein